LTAGCHRAHENKLIDGAPVDEVSPAGPALSPAAAAETARSIRYEFAFYGDRCETDPSAGRCDGDLLGMTGVFIRTQDGCLQDGQGQGYVRWEGSPRERIVMTRGRTPEADCTTDSQTFLSDPDNYMTIQVDFSTARVTRAEKLGQVFTIRKSRVVETDSQ
jgi:hypothetical protein